MTERALVITTDGSSAQVMPFEKDACATCGGDCEKKHSTFLVKNPKNLPIKTGSLVTLQSSKKAQALEGLVSLIFPILCSIAGFFLATPFMRIFGKTAGEGAKALGVLLMLILSSTLVYLISRKIPKKGIPEICALE